MPVYKSFNPDNETTVKIWHISEDAEQLSKGLFLTDNSESRYSGMKSAIHQAGFLSIRHLLNELNYSDQDLYYDDNGKPHLRDGKFISISHSFEFSGIIVSDHPVGIDIEKQRPKIKRIAPKFIDYEFQYLKQDDPELTRKLTTIWCIKESLYKLFAQPGLSFRQHTLVIPFEMTDGSTVSWIDYESKKKRYTAEFLEFDGFGCAYVRP